MTKSRFVRKIGRIIITGVQFGCVAHCFLEYVADVVVCSGLSMEPSIHSGDVLLTEHVSASFHHFKRGDIVISRSPVEPQHFVCKRIIALPGEYVDNQTIPKGHLWLAGDNQLNSLDSWTYGPVPQALVRGRVICKLWPLQDARMLSDHWLPFYRDPGS